MERALREEAQRTDEQHGATDRRLIEEWLPIAALGEESVRERRSMTALPPTYYLHVWWARRPLVASRAAILGALLPADADRERFLHVLGIHGDPVAAKLAIDHARRTGQRVENPYHYDRAFQYVPSPGDLNWLHGKRARPPRLLDCTAGGGSVPFESIRLGCETIANDLNPVAWLILRATVEFPARFGRSLSKRFEQLAATWSARVKSRVGPLFPEQPDRAREDATFLWARTIRCPYCGGLVPLSPNWRLDGKGTGVRLLPDIQNSRDRHVGFEIVHSAKEQSEGTVKGGDARCPFPDCGRVIDGEVIKRQAQAGEMGEQLYAVVYRERVVVGRTKAGKDRIRVVRGYRAPRPEDDVSVLVRRALEERMPEWTARGIIPDEEIDHLSNYDRGHRLYGVRYWRDMFPDVA